MMRAVQFTPGTPFQVVELEIPVLRSDEVLVKVEACGICGSDRQVYASESVPMGTEFPVVMGHEIAGEIAGMGPDVTTWTAGQRVVVHPFIECGTCAPCIALQPNLCIRQTCIGYQRQGGFAEYVTVPSDSLIAIPDDLSGESAALLVDAFATPYHAMHKAGVDEDKSVLVIGAGGLGIAALMLAQAFNVRKLGAVTRRASGVDTLAANGAEMVVSMADDERTIGRSLRRFAGAGGIDVVIDTVGDSRTVRFATEVVRFGGMVSVVGMSDEEVTLPIAKLVRRGIQLQYSYASVKEDVEILVQWAAADRLKPADLIADELSLEQVETAFSVERKPGRYVVLPNKHL